MSHKKLYLAFALATLLLLGLISTNVIRYFVAHESPSDTIADETLPLTSDNVYSEIEREDEELVALMARADEALYAFKCGGGDRGTDA